MILFLSKENHSISQRSKSMPQPNDKEAEIERFYEDLKDILEHQKEKKKDILFIIEDQNAKVGNQEIPEIAGKFGLRVQNEARQRLTEFCQETLFFSRTEMRRGEKIK